MACTTSDFNSALSYALQRLGTPDLEPKPEQIAAMQSIYKRRDVFVWLPTGFGKYLCYETLPFLCDWKLGRVDHKPSVVIAISLLVTLMVDQVKSLRRRKVQAAIITSGGGVEKALLAAEKSLAECSLLY